MKNNKTLPLGATMLVASLAATPVLAQQRVIEEVIITAQKTKQSIQDVPISVTAIGGDFMKDVGISDLKELSVYVPNVRIDANDPGSPQIFIRGFGTNTFNPSFESSVGFVQDEVFFGRPAYFTEAMFDIDRVEVLRGPQGTLFGKNTVSGVFSVYSRPVSQEFSADLELRVGERGEQRIEGGAGGMLNEWFGLRVSALDFERDGELENQFLNRNEENPDQDAQRIKLNFLPGESTEFELIAVGSDTRINYWPKQLANLDADTRDYLDDFDPAIEDDPENFKTSYNIDGMLEKGSRSYTGKLSHSFGEAGALYNLDTVVVYGTSDLFIEQYQDLDVSPADIATLVNREDYQQDTLEWRFTGDAGSLFGFGSSLQFVAGVFYFESDYQLDAGVVLGRDVGSWLGTNDAQLLAGEDAPLLPALQLAAMTTTNDRYDFDYVQNTEAWALFGQLTLNLGDSWVITPGLRMNRETKKIDTLGTGSCEGSTPLPPPSCVASLLLGANDYSRKDLERKESDVSPKLSVMYYLTDDVNVFVTYSKGFKSGGYNSISFTGVDLEFEGENAVTLEIGTKGSYLGQSLNINATAYRTEYENLQVLAFNGVFFDVSNAATAVSQGLEVDWQWLTPWQPLSLLGSLGILDAYYEEYTGAPAPVTKGVDTKQDLTDETIAFAPKNSLMLSPTLTFPVFDNLLNLSMDVIHQGEQYTDTDLDPASRVPANTKLNFRVALLDGDEWWTITAGIKNLSDKRTQNQVVDSVFFPGTYYAQQNSGRQAYAALRFNW
ncbi:MAG: iron complex outermembrane receptor protein [Bermanella sp.]|jgi:iron complex outermembrane receptor protein